MKAAVTPEQLDIMRHATGQNYDPPHKRNSYCAHLQGDDIVEIRALVQAGLMAAGRTINDGQDQYFTVTDAGIAVVPASKPPKPTPTRAQRRYQEYLDADTGLSFREYMGWARRTSAREDGHAG